MKIYCSLIHEYLKTVNHLKLRKNDQYATNEKITMKFSQVSCIQVQWLPFIVITGHCYQTVSVITSQSSERMYTIGLKIHSLLESLGWHLRLILSFCCLCNLLFSFEKYRMYYNCKQKLQGGYSLHTVHSGIISIPSWRAKHLSFIWSHTHTHTHTAFITCISILTVGVYGFFWNFNCNNLFIFYFLLLYCEFYQHSTVYLSLIHI